MKKNRMLLMCVCLFFVLLGACGRRSGDMTEHVNEKQQSDSERLHIVTTKFAAYDFARAVCGEYAEITMLLPPGSESHTYEPTPQDIIAIEECDMFIYNGGESEAWVEDLLQDIDPSKVSVISFMEQVLLYEEESVEGMEEEQEGGQWDAIKEEQSQEEEEYDEHVWTSPKNAIAIVRKICEVCKTMDRPYSKIYEKQANAYVKQLEHVDKEFIDAVSKGKTNKMVFGDRFPLRYFAEEYGLEYYAAFPGCAEDTEPSVATMIFLIDKVREEKLPVVFHIELSNEEIANTISESTNAKSLLFHSCQGISKKDFEAGKTYVDFMEENVVNVRAALGVE